MPTISESGLPGYEAAGWFGVLVPAGTPKPVVAKLNAGINRVLETAEVKASLAADGAEAAGGTPSRWRSRCAKVSPSGAKWYAVSI